MPDHLQGIDCILCGAPAVPFFELPSVPVNVSQLFFDAEEARNAPAGKLALAFCSSCGGVFNAAWDPSRFTYDTRYENSLDASEVFDEYAGALAHRLAAAYPLEGGTIVEIGCGQARFLERLCSAAKAAGIGFDPSYTGGGDGRVRVERRLFDPASAQGAAMILCRHVLEHLHHPHEFLAGLAAACKDSGSVVLYFEVPNAAVIFNGVIPWDLIYPHISYFTIGSFSRLFARAGFHVLAAGTAYSDQFLYVEATPGAAVRDARAEADPDIAVLARGFSDLLSSIVLYWTNLLVRAKETGTRVALWGAGAKGVTFLNAVPGARDIACVVDLNPRKHGSFIPGTGQKVSPPEILREFRPEVVIAVNPIYLAEIRRELDRLGLDAVVAAGPEKQAQAA